MESRHLVTIALGGEFTAAGLLMQRWFPGVPVWVFCLLFAVLRLTIFFVGTIAVIAALVPFETAGVGESPFVTVFDRAGLPFGAETMNFVIITAVPSAGNSGLYSCTRMLNSLGEHSQARRARPCPARRDVVRGAVHRGVRGLVLPAPRPGLAAPPPEA